MDGIYSSEWFKCSPNIRRGIRFCMMRANKIKIMDGGFYVASLPTFTAVRINAKLIK